MAEDFTWRDGERAIRFGDGVASEAPGLLGANGFERFVLVTTERAAGGVPGLAERAADVLGVPAGKVDDISAALLRRMPDGPREEPGERAAGRAPGEGGARERRGERLPLVALGGGRVVDTAKALAGATRVRCAAIPTTLSGAEMTPFHRLPAGVEGARMVRPALVIADPDLMAGAPPTRLAASAMNALAHAMEALYTPLRSPVTDLAALRAAELLSRGITRDPPERGDLALGALMAGWASGSTGIAFHHALCQTLVRTAGSPHAETNAVVLPHSARLMAGRAPGAMSDLARALGDGRGDPEAAAGDIARIAARCGHTRLSTLGVKEEHLPGAASAAAAHPAIRLTPDPPDEAELLDLLRAAL
ncbi:MAG TPA: iron-containing alcohol dehydrogenase [Thermoleophilaceae bacterium]|nr:iron-containing alcohol dehydrogenase [Thermoleophilaceae bacterium]